MIATLMITSERGGVTKKTGLLDPKYTFDTGLLGDKQSNGVEE